MTSSFQEVWCIWSPRFTLDLNSSIKTLEHWSILRQIWNDHEPDFATMDKGMLRLRNLSILSSEGDVFELAIPAVFLFDHVSSVQFSTQVLPTSLTCQHSSGVIKLLSQWNQVNIHYCLILTVSISAHYLHLTLLQICACCNLNCQLQYLK